MSFAEHVAAHRAGTLSASAFVREVMGATAWYVPARRNPDGQVGLALAKNDKGTWMQAFSTLEALKHWTSGRGISDTSAKLTGLELAKVLVDPVDGLNLDPGTDHGVHYTADKLPTLRHMAEAVHIGQILQGVAVPNAWQWLVRYGGWRVCYRQAEGADGQATRSLMLAPDSEGRKLLAVFTAPDTVEAFAAQAEHALGERPHQGQLPGAELFKMVSGMEIDGMVFDAAGPTAPRAVTSAFATKALDLGSAPPTEGTSLPST